MGAEADLPLSREPGLALYDFERKRWGGRDLGAWEPLDKGLATPLISNK